MTALVDKMDVVVLPVLNVDGYDYTWKKVKRADISGCECYSELFLSGCAANVVQV